MTRPSQPRGAVDAAYKPKWDLDFQFAVNRLLIDAGIAKRGEAGGLLKDAELVEMGEAMRDGVSAEAFAARIIDRAARERVAGAA